MRLQTGSLFHWSISCGFSKLPTRHGHRWSGVILDAFCIPDLRAREPRSFLTSHTWPLTRFIVL